MRPKKPLDRPSVQRDGCRMNVLESLQLISGRLADTSVTDLIAELMPDFPVITGPGPCPIGTIFAASSPTRPSPWPALFPAEPCANSI